MEAGDDVAYDLAPAAVLPSVPEQFTAVGSPPRQWCRTLKYCQRGRWAGAPFELAFRAQVDRCAAPDPSPDRLFCRPIVRASFSAAAPE